MKYLIAVSFLVKCSFAFAQYQWKPLLASNNSYIGGGSVWTLSEDTIHHILITGSKCNEQNFVSGGSCCNAPIYIWNSNLFSTVDCEPTLTIGTTIDSSIVLSSSNSVESVYNHTFLAEAGRFTDQSCFSTTQPTSFSNLVFYADLTPSYYINENMMSCSDTVFAVSTIADHDNLCLVNPENYFRTYVAAKCVFCDCNIPSTIDSNRFIAAFDPMVGCNAVNRIDFMNGGTDGPVYCITALDTERVFAGGDFQNAGGIATSNIAIWNGNTWDSLGSGINGTVLTSCYLNGELFVGGEFTNAGGVSANNIAMWNGNVWSSLGNGTNGTVTALTTIGNKLYVGGQFSLAGTVSVNNLAQWDGTNWTDVFGGRNGKILALSTFQKSLVAGGNFSGGLSDSVKYLAILIDTSATNVEEIDLEHDSIRVFPNPAFESLNIFSEVQIETITIIDNEGKVVDEFDTPPANLTLNVERYNEGIYLIRIDIDYTVLNYKVLILR